MARDDGAAGRGPRVILPAVPSYLSMSDGTQFALSVFDDEVLREVAARWTEEFIARAHRQRANVDQAYRHIGVDPGRNRQ